MIPKMKRMILILLLFHNGIRNSSSTTILYILCVCLVCVCIKNKPTTTNKSNQIKSNKYDNQPKRGSGGVGWAGTAKEQQQRSKSKQQAAAAVVVVGLVWFPFLVLL